jgi:hypothetical protein
LRDELLQRARTFVAARGLDSEGGLNVNGFGFVIVEYMFAKPVYVAGESIPEGARGGSG